MDEYKSARLDAVLAAAADPTRRAILAQLASGQSRVTDLASRFPISLNSTSKHIKVLERAGLVRRSVRGRDHLISLDAQPLAEAARWIDHYRRFWDERLEALDHYVSKGAAKRRKDDQ